MCLHVAHETKKKPNLINISEYFQPKEIPKLVFRLRVTGKGKCSVRVMRSGLSRGLRGWDEAGGIAGCVRSEGERSAN